MPKPSDVEIEDVDSAGVLTACGEAESDEVCQYCMNTGYICLECNQPADLCSCDSEPGDDAPVIGECMDCDSDPLAADLAATCGGE